MRRGDVPMLSAMLISPTDRLAARLCRAVSIATTMSPLETAPNTHCRGGEDQSPTQVLPTSDDIVRAVAVGPDGIDEDRGRGRIYGVRFDVPRGVVVELIRNVTAGTHPFMLPPRLFQGAADEALDDARTIAKPIADANQLPIAWWHEPTPNRVLSIVSLLPHDGSLWTISRCVRPPSVASLGMYSRGRAIWVGGVRRSNSADGSAKKVCTILADRGWPRRAVCRRLWSLPQISEGPGAPTPGLLELRRIHATRSRVALTIA